MFENQTPLGYCNKYTQYKRRTLHIYPSELLKLWKMKFETAKPRSLT